MTANTLTLSQRVVNAEYGNGSIGIYKREVAQIVLDRVGSLCLDHRTFLYVRLHNFHNQHALGRGDLTSALTAFSAINLLSKVCYFIDKPQRFDMDPIYYFRTNETNAFCHFIKLLADNDIFLGIKKNDSASQKLVWSGFRDFLAHIGVVERGKRVVTFELAQPIQPGETIDIETKINDMLMLQVFRDDGDGRNWQVYIDTLFAKLEKEILPFVVEQIITYKAVDEQAARNLYKLVSGERDLP